MDHFNNIPGDDRINNLREVSHSINMRKKRVYKNSRFKVTGVSMANGKYVAYIQLRLVESIWVLLILLEEAVIAFEDNQKEDAQMLNGEFGVCLDSIHICRSSSETPQGVGPSKA